MSQKTIVLVIVLFAVLVAGMFTFAFLKKAELDAQAQDDTNRQTQSDQVDPYPTIEVITAKHYFIDGTHTFVGVVPFPTPCDLLTVESRVQESFPEQIVLDFSVINNADSCEQIPTDQRFQVTVSASSEAAVIAVFMGRSVPLNIIPAAEGETPDEFELFLKG